MKYALLALILAAGGAHAQYRCGNTYQQTPCPGAVVTPVAPAAASTSTLPPLGRAVPESIEIGMGFAQVYEAMGRRAPQRTNTLRREGVVVEQLIWDTSARRSTYVYLANGKVTAVETASR